MTKRSRNESVEALGVEVPAGRALEPIEAALESLSDLAARRDCLRLLAERASAEAVKLDSELSRAIDSHERELRSLAERIRR